MKITELLNVPLADHHGQANKSTGGKRMDMASLDLFAKQQQHQCVLCLSFRFYMWISELMDGYVSLWVDDRHATPVEDNEPVVMRPELSMQRIVQELSMKQQVAPPVTAASSLHLAVPRPPNLQPDSDAPMLLAATSPQAQARGKQTSPTPSPGDKRVKQRMLVKKSYYRKLDTLKELRDAVQELEADYEQLLITRRREQQDHSKDEETSLMDRYVQAAICTDELRKENADLRTVAADQSKARTRIGILVNEELKDQHDAAKQLAALEVGVNPATAVLRMTPLTLDECMEIMRDAYREAMKFHENEHYVTTGASVFGWRDRRKIDGNLLKFMLTKSFMGYTAERVSSAVWNVLSNPEAASHIYSSSLRSRFHLVQRVNDQNVLFYRVIQTEVGQIKSLVLCSRIHIGDGSYMIIFRSIDPTDRNVRFPGGGDPTLDNWSDVFSWGLYKQIENGTEDSFGGYIPYSRTAGEAFWLMEVLMIAVRLETEATGSAFLLPQSDEISSDEGGESPR